MLYFFITQLPKIDIQKKNLISKKKFINDCYKYLSKNELKELLLILNINAYREELKKRVAKNDTYNFLNSSFNLRNIYKKIYLNSKNSFLKKWARYNLNFEEAITGILCKKFLLNKNSAKEHFIGHFDSTGECIIRNYAKDDIGLSNRLPFFNNLQKLINNNSITEIQYSLDLMRINIIKLIEPLNCFSLDYLLSYYLQLSIVERNNSFNEVDGKNVLTNLIKSIEVFDD